MDLEQSPQPVTILGGGIDVGAFSIHGRGLIASEPIPAADVVLRWGGVVVTAADLASGRLGPGSWGQIDEDAFLFGPADAADYFLNHSCDPNVWLRGASTLVARRDIAVGEEIVGDYGTWEADPRYVLEPCACGTTVCRGRVTGDDWRRTELRQRYARHFVPFLEERSRGLPQF